MALSPSAIPPVSGAANIVGAPLGQTSPVVIYTASPAKDELSERLSATSAVLWPLVVALALVLFRTQVADLAGRIRKGKAFGAEAEFDRKELVALNAEAVKASAETVAVGLPDGDQANADDGSAAGDEVKAIVLKESARSPRVGLMLLSAEIDKLARRIAAATGHLKAMTLREQLGIWASSLPPHTSVAYALFSQIRNRIIHGAAASDQEILSAIDSGLLLYGALRSIPIEENTVLYPGIPIYSDENLTTPAEGKGLIMETMHSGKRTLRIFPTTLSHYQRGMRLTWEWNMSRVWGRAWYRDPDSGDVNQAWHSSAEFIGRDLDQV